MTTETWREIGQRYMRQAMVVHCPLCGAARGVPCRKMRGSKTGEAEAPHARRIKLARRASGGTQ